MKVGFAYQGLLDHLRAITFSPKKYTLVVIHGFESNSGLFLGRKKIQTETTTTKNKSGESLLAGSVKVCLWLLMTCLVKRAESC